MKQTDCTNVLRMVARKEGTTLEEVIAEIDLAIHEALANAKQDRVLMKRWEQIPRAGDVPTAQELLDYLCESMTLQ